MTDIPINAKVECSDGPCGHSTYLIANPVERRITHFVVKDEMLPGSSDRLVPVDKVADTSGDLIQLNCSRAELAEMKPFTTMHYVKGVAPTYIDTSITPDADVIWEDPVVAYDTEAANLPEHHVPAAELAVYRGMAVNTGDHKVGQVDELVVDPGTGNITHLLMQKGHLWGKKDVAVPVSAIDFVGQHTVWLKIDKKAVGALPAVPIKRHST